MIFVFSKGINSEIDIKCVAFIIIILLIKNHTRRSQNTQIKYNSESWWKMLVQSHFHGFGMIVNGKISKMDRTLGKVKMKLHPRK